MSTQIKDGGPAFPISVTPVTDLHGRDLTSGMTLRDWFAGHSLPEAVADYDRVGRGPQNGNSLLPYATKGSGTREEIIARQAYRYADAMLKAREKSNV